MDSAEKSEKLINDLRLSYPVLSDPGREVIRMYGVEDAENEISWPVIFIVDTQGKVRWRGPLETFKKRPPPDEVLAQLDKLKGS